MTLAHHRPKDPAQVRGLLMQAATALARDHGLAAVTLDAVAAMAGVTKGALFHHFGSKQALVDAVFAGLLADFASALDAQMQADPDPQGRFSRAYVALSVQDDDPALTALWLSAMADARLRQSWRDWLAARTAAHAESAPGCEAARLAADGMFYARLAGLVPTDTAALERRLNDLTREAP